MGLRVLVTALIGGLVVISQSTPARADAAEIEALIAKGNELRRAGTPGPALPYFQKAYELARTPRTLGQLGLAELAAGYPVEAADHLTAALQSPNDPSIVRYKQMLADALTMARSQIGELAVQGSPPGAEVVVDGRAVGALPLAAPVKLAARGAEVVVRAAGFAPHKEQVSIAGGQRQQLIVNLEKLEQAAPAAPTVTAAVPPPSPAVSPPAAPAPAPAATVEDRSGSRGGSSGGLRTAAWITGGAAVVAAGAGVGLNLAARSNRADPDAWQSYRRWSIVGYASAGALAVTSAVLFWVSRPTSLPASAHAHIQCAPSPIGVSCLGIF